MILLGVTGSIAAYKAVEILRLLLKAGKPVQVVMTAAAGKFVTPLTFQSLSGRPVLSDLFEAHQWQMAHLAVSGEAKAILVAPASADALSKMARGGADDPVAAAVLSAPRKASGELAIPVYLAPAMHQEMWIHPATQTNARMLKSYGYRFLGPERGALGRAGDLGMGRMSEPEAIVKDVLKGAR